MSPKDSHKSMTRILLADDHRVLLDGLKSLIERERDLEIVAEAMDGREAVRKVLDEKPDVAVMDIGMPELNGIEAARQIHSRSPDTRLLALSVHSDRSYVRAMLSAGASGYLLKKAASDELIEAIRTVARGRFYLCRELQDEVMGDYVERLASQEDDGPLTDRERQILQLIAEGASTKEIAAALHVSASTVDTHRRHIMDKLKLTSVAELTKYAVRHGLTSLD